MSLIKVPICFLGILFIAVNLQEGCGSYKSKTGDTSSKAYSQLLKVRENQAASKQTDYLGVLLDTIHFECKTKNLTDFSDGIMPWIDFNALDKELPELINKDRKVLSNPKITVIIDYPVTNEYRFTLVSDTGFTRERLVKEIYKAYLKLYKEEEKTATTKTIPTDKRTAVYNRNQTDGKYGVWGHDIADLALVNIIVYQSANGEILLSLDIDS